MIFCIESQKILLNPKLLEGKLINISLRIEENQAPNAINARYFQSRSDYYRAIEHFHYAKAEVV